MIKHIVMWRFKAGTQDQMHKFLKDLAALQGQIPQLISSEIGVNVNPDNNYDATFIGVYASLEDLNIYKKDPRHVAVSSQCKAIREERGAVDFEF